MKRGRDLLTSLEKAISSFSCPRKVKSQDSIFVECDGFFESILSSQLSRIPTGPKSLGLLKKYVI